MNLPDTNLDTNLIVISRNAMPNLDVASGAALLEQVSAHDVTILMTPTDAHRLAMLTTPLVHAVVAQPRPSGTAKQKTTEQKGVRLDIRV